MTPGDHDVDPPAFVPNSSDDSRRRFYYDLYHANESKLSPGLFHSFEVGVLSLQGNAVSMKLIPLDGGGPLTFTSRIGMDRVQVLSIILGSLYDFGSKNQLCAGDGKIYGRGGNPPQLLLIPVGNPIDLPLALSVSIAPDSKFALDTPQFTKGSCQSMSLAGECILSSSSRVETSNNSIVAQ